MHPPFRHETNIKGRTAKLPNLFDVLCQPLKQISFVNTLE